ncbi:hypothetical protein A3F07_03315 [candidate division WWE3 bacterium RIFCSPHIGHO2_12_FULL_38_15]|uniref:Uncharacterized protein n=1 Tax=candidate division WWE3 bacterium RIFCSPHIGHO2_02_FULL_38_14 TaxID=1802620 RepID=A0A1F4V6G2_UNCKA|nr:MAG: hypothetical protein A2793_03070 [candidate division WWE3 bacterium RIFCSPHIGHO2_01_FULL_38_45]OGC48831.1 MAG: hypothetical protein A3F07_03315 [candidate division WWE3 bacterium RIFCSPHIGHO2_12_FULL_38_15]OGC52787.1 MAG: hypothetical protein A3D91_02005 [candidate division WWE3 bacterium RIFCSPHIGHO2_02_FULL_38_14]OGC53134.1 MAG: hypothetical protein A3B64_01655 [candidate division WWE3 bacterium RIFCSPLOWO2_01_FULL_37_24]HLB51973.1 hypothetical protein [Patescibacteria group bacterium
MLKIELLHNLNQKGQALLFVVVALTIALALGVGVSLRELTSSSRVSRTDTSSRVLGAAEGGAERFLTLSRAQLERASAPLSNTDCPPNTTFYDDTQAGGKDGCKVAFNPTTGDNIRAEAIVRVSTFKYNSADNLAFETVIPSGEVREINTEGAGAMSLQLCWRADPDNGGNTPVDLYYIDYGAQGVYVKQGVRAGTRSGTYVESLTFVDASSAPANCSALGYRFTRTVTLDTSLGRTPYGLRIRSLNTNVKMRVMPTTNVSLFPIQGYKIDSTGMLSSISDVSVTATAQVLAYRSLPYLPVVFDFGLYSEAAL